MLSKYIHKFKTLVVKQNMSYFNKPILLLTVMEMVENYLIYENKISPTEVLYNHFYQNWLQFIGLNSDYNSNCWDPFCGLTEDGFWHLEYKGNKKESSDLLSEKKNRTERNVKNSVYYATIDEELFLYLQDDNSRKTLQDVIIQKYIKSHSFLLAESDAIIVETNKPNDTILETSSTENSIVEVKSSPILNLYSKDFTNLHISQKYGGAPHKPVLLLALLTMLDDNVLQCNEIYLNDITKEYFRRTWDSFVGIHNFFQPTCWMPFLFLKHEDFWHFEFLTSEEIFESLFEDKTNRKESLLKEHVRFAYLDSKLYDLLNDPHKREVLRKAITEKYFNCDRSTTQLSLNEEIHIEKDTEESPDQYKKHVENCDDIYIQYNLVYFKQLNVKKKRGILRTIAPSPVELYKLVHCDSSKIDTFHYKEKELLADLLKQIRMALDDYPTEVVALKQAISKAKNAPSTPVSQSVSSAQTSLELVRQIIANKEEKLRKAEEEKLLRKVHQKAQKETPAPLERKVASQYVPNERESVTTPTSETFTTTDRPSPPFVTHKCITSDLNSRQKAVLKAMRRFREPAYPTDIFRMVSWSEWGNSSLNADSVDSVLKTLREVQYIKWGKYILKEYLPEDVKENHGDAHSNSITSVIVEKEEPKEYPSLYAGEVEKINSAINEIKPFLVSHEIYKPSLYGSKWSREDDDIVKTHYSIGSSIPTIAKILDRTIPSVIARLDRVCGKDWTMPGIERGEDGYFLFTEETIEIILHSWDCLKPVVIESMRNNHLIPLIGCHCTISLLSSLCRIKYE